MSTLAAFTTFPALTALSPLTMLTTLAVETATTRVEKLDHGHKATLGFLVDQSKKTTMIRRRGGQPFCPLRAIRMTAVLLTFKRL